MSTPVGCLRNYPRNSPEAIARVVVMMMVTDTTVDAREIEALRRLDAFERIGLSRPAFMRVARDYCSDLVQMIGDRDAMPLVDDALIDAVIAPVDEPQLRTMVCSLLVGVVAADGELAGAELAVLERVLKRWDIRREALADAIADDVARHASTLARDDRRRDDRLARQPRSTGLLAATSAHRALGAG